MKLIKFIGKGIRGYMNHEINFREGVTFLIGMNGSGKTSVLKLINGLFLPSYKILETIEYSYIELTFRHDGKDYVLSSKKDKETISICLDHLLKEQLEDKFTRYISLFSDTFDDDPDLEIYDGRFKELPTCMEIRRLTKPLFIGIERMLEEDIVRMVRRNLHALKHEASSISSVDNCLNALQTLIIDKYRETSVQINKESEQLRKNILKEAISLITSTPSIFEYKRPTDSEIQQFDNKKEEFIQALMHAGIDNAEEMVNNYFLHQREYLDIITEKKKVDEKRQAEAIITWSLSSTQMSKIDQIISHESVYRAQVERYKDSYTRFEECVNMFFKESGKEIKVLPTGLINIVTHYKTEDGRNRPHKDDIKSLSSGEKQIVALIGSLVFTAVSRVRPEVIVIDEPELSLHLSWQELFVDAITKAQPNYQFILATHAPAIIAKNERREWCEDLSCRIY